jgi:hypothetical protein
MKKEIAILAAVALGSMAAGFVLVLLVLGGGESRTLPDPFAEAPAAPEGGGGRGVARDGGKHPEGPPTQPEPEKPRPEPEKPQPATPEPPPPVKPAQGKLALEVGAPFVWRCWAEGESDPVEKQGCGSLDGVEALVNDNLGAIETCVLDHAGGKASGKLSLALKLDFGSGKVNAWLGNSTTVSGPESISACLRSAFETKLPPPIGHDFARYIVFFTIDVG